MTVPDCFIVEPAAIVSPTLGVKRDWIVAVRDGVIDYVGPPREPDRNGAVRRYRTRGVLAPGFIDTHVHLMGGVTASDFTDVHQVLNAARNCRRALDAGITTVADLGARSQAIFEVVRCAEEGILQAPRIQSAGQAVCMTGGHGRGAVSVEADGPTGVRAAVRRQLGAGARVVKLMATGGSGSPHEAQGGLQFEVAELQAGVEEAHKAQVPVTAHATSTAGITRALDAGVRVIQHGIGIDAATARRMTELGAILVPTLSVHLRSSLQTLAQTPRYMREKAARAYQAHRTSFEAALEAGVRIGFGTDTGGEYHPLGDIAIEIELMHELGMTAAGILAALTANNAQWLGIRDQTGDLVAGLAADLVVLDGSPENDWQSLTRPLAVWRGGTLVRSASTAIDVLDANDRIEPGGAVRA